jgi:hypothetical protein
MKKLEECDETDDDVQTMSNYHLYDFLEIIDNKKN